jgi:hypothetical protein
MFDLNYFNMCVFMGQHTYMITAIRIHNTPRFRAIYSSCVSMKRKEKISRSLGVHYKVNVLNELI